MFGGIAPPLNASVSRHVSEVLSSYAAVTDVLTPVLHNLPGKVIGIDGGNGTGKTTLGRYLAWHFNVTLIESDLFADDVLSGTYRLDEIRRLIRLRLEKPRPVIVEGICLLRLLRDLAVPANVLVYCKSRHHGESDTLGNLLARYEQEFFPESRAAVIANNEWCDG